MLNKKNFVLIGLIITSLLMITAILTYVVNHSGKGDYTSILAKGQDLSVTQQLQNNNREVIKITDEKSAKELLKLRSRPIIIAIYGSDARTSEPSRSDVIMLMKYYPMTNEALLLSIPRDTRVDIPGKKIDKINHAYAFGGAKLLTQTLEKLFSTKIDYYLKFNFSDFEAIIDKLDGVTVNSVKAYGYEETVVPEGTNTLTGEQALFFVSFRHDANGDFGRIKRQQEVIVSLTQKLYNTDLIKLERLLTEIYSSYLDTNISLPAILDYQRIFDSSKQIKFDTYSLKTEGKMIDRIYYGIADKDSLERLRQLLHK